MFKENIEHFQTSMFNSTDWMNPGIKSKLEKSWAPVFYEYVFCNIDEKPFARLYSDIGRSNFPVNIALSLEFIKHMKNISDDELIENFYFNYLVTYAIGIRTLGEINLAERTLYEFRNRVYQYLVNHPHEEDLIFGQFLNLTRKFAQTAGISLEIQRMDTTMFMSNIKKAGRLALAFDVLLRAVKAIPESLRTESLQETLSPKFKTDILYRSKPSENESKLDRLLNLCLEALNIMTVMPDMKKSDELRIVKRFISEQSDLDNQTNRLKAKDNKNISASSLQSAFDEDATYRQKGNHSQSGFVASIAETCSKENPVQLITDYAVEPNVVSDIAIADERLPKIEDTGCGEMYVDGGFYPVTPSSDNPIAIHYTDMTGREPSKKLSVTEFEIDPGTKIITQCPGGNCPINAGITSGQTVAYFLLEACANCAYKDQCYSKQQKKSCVVRINLKSVDAAKVRAQIKQECKENTSMRAAIEGTNSALKRAHGLDKLRVRSIAKCRAVVGYKIIAQNFKRFANVMLGRIPTVKIPLQGELMPV